MKKICLLGATGSIGTTTLDLVRRNPEKYKVVAVSGFSRVEKLEALVEEFNVSHVYEIGENIADFIKNTEADVVLNAVSGFAGLDFSRGAIEAGVDLALANKESLVVAGDLILPLAREKGVKILPVDSEHSAIWQALGMDSDSDFISKNLEKIYLTASGGPFFGQTDLSSITPDQALKHPNWDMGTGITIDSATLANKCLEFIEAMHLFGVSSHQIEIIIHPQSIVHSMVEWQDGSVIAQLSPPSMELPIAVALNYPERMDVGAKRQSFLDLDLQFRRPDKNTFKTLQVLDHVAEHMGTLPIVFNAVNESARGAFLREEISFTDIFSALEEIVLNWKYEPVESFEQIYSVDQKAREMTQKWFKSFS